MKQGSQHHSPFLQNFFIAVAMIGFGSLYYLQEFNVTSFNIPDKMFGYVMAFLLVTNGFYRLKKAFEWRVIHF